MAKDDDRSDSGQAASDEDLERQYPRPEALDNARRLLRSGAQARVVSFLRRLAARPPQVVLLEGGRVEEREAMALCWAASFNCRPAQPQASLLAPGAPAEKPCLRCVECLTLFAGEHRDLFFFDGREKSIKIGPIRAQVKPHLGEPPRGEGRRAVVLVEAQSLTLDAANSLLKALEEPNPFTVFVLTAPQRERLLPTFVSRSFTLTLAWPSAADAPAAGGLADPARLELWTSDMLHFLRTGQGWFAKTGIKGAVDRVLAQALTLSLQRELLRTLAGSGQTRFSQFLGETCDPTQLRRFDAALFESQEALRAGVNPALTLDWLAARLYAVLAR